MCVRVVILPVKPALTERLSPRAWKQKKWHFAKQDALGSHLFAKSL